MPELSIIVPVYKVEKYLPRCIDSILTQTFRDFELILIDDGSPDNCGAICDEYAARDSRIRVIHQENAGVSAARNAGLDIATGTYLGFVDSDDWIEPEMYETMIATAKEKQVDVVVCGFEVRTETGECIEKSNRTEGSYTQEQLLKAVYTTPNPLDGVCWNKIFSRECVKDIRYPLGTARFEDTIYMLRCFFRFRNGYKIGATLYNVVERIGSATRSDNPNLEFDAITGGYRLYRLHRDSLFADVLHPLAANKFLNDCIRYGANIRSIAKNTREKCWWVIMKTKVYMLKVIIRAYFHKLLPKAKIHGYIMGMIKL